MKIALISTGLGHIRRGIETWTADLGLALHERNMSVIVYKGGGKSERVYERVIPCWKRDNGLSKWIIAHRPGFMWRAGFSTGYTLEQITFTLCIIPILLVKQFDIIHTQDPQVAEYLQRLNRWKLLKSKVILAHGTEEPHEYLAQFDYLQHLAPFHKEETESHGYKGKKWFAIGNYVDTNKFKPENSTNLRKELKIAADAFVVLSVAAIKKTHKRIDYLINEVSRIDDPKVVLVVAGSTGLETPELLEMGKEKLGDRVRFLQNFPHERMAEVHAMADVFALCSLKDMMPIALLEAIASGLPALVHQYPVEEWMVGDGGSVIDMSKEGELANTIKQYIADVTLKKDKSAKARKQAVDVFSKEAVLGTMMRMYEDVRNDS